MIRRNYIWQEMLVHRKYRLILFSVLWLYFFNAVCSNVCAQSKKEIIQDLNTQIDSLYNVVVFEKKQNQDQKNKADSLISLLNRERAQMSSAKMKFEESDDKKNKEIQYLNDKVSNLSRQIEILKSQKDSIQRYFEGLIQEAGVKYDGIRFPYPLNGKYEDYNLTVEMQIIVDSALMRINELETFKFFFLTPLEYKDYLACPGEYGFIVANKKSDVIHKQFWELSNDESFVGNFSPQIINLKLKNGYRNILSIASSGCGSGATSFYYDVVQNNESLDFKLLFSDGAGYSCYHFIPEKEIYLNVERINPECHYSCPSRYSITSFNANNDQKLRSYQTKNLYDDYNDTGVEELLNIIHKKEPNILTELF